jgi:hypothetical protein
VIVSRARARRSSAGYGVVVAPLDDPRGALDDAAPGGEVADDFGVGLGGGGCESGVGEGVEVGAAADAGEVAAFGQFPAEGDGVDGVAIIDEGAGGLVDGGVGGPVEVAGHDERVHGALVGGSGEEETAEVCLFGVEVLRGDPLETAAARAVVGVVAVAVEVADVLHGAPRRQNRAACGVVLCRRGAVQRCSAWCGYGHGVGCQP